MIDASELTGKVPADSSSVEIDVLRIVQVLWTRRVSIGALTLAMGLFGYGLASVLPKTYVAEASILPAATSPDPTALLGAGLASQFGSMTSLLPGMKGGKGADLVEILNSRRLADLVIARCHLDREFKGWKYRSEINKKLGKLVTISAPTLKNRIIAITVEAPAPSLAADIANTYLDELRKVVNEMEIGDEMHTRVFLEKQLRETRRQLTRAEEDLSTYQTSHQLASLPEAVSAAMKSLGDLESQRLAIQLQSRAAEASYGSLKDKISTLQMDPMLAMDLEIKRRSLAAEESAVGEARAQYLRKVADLPPKMLKLARLQRDVQMLNGVYLVLTQQVQMARMNERMESRSFTLLDQAIVPDRHQRPSRVAFTLLGLLLGGAFAVARAFWLEGDAA